MTYLEAINSVLRRLREDQAATVLESDYSALIGDFINDAKRIVENSWNWSALRDTISVVTANGVSEYSLVGSGQEAVVKNVLNDSANKFMGLETKDYFNSVYYLQDVVSGTPHVYTFIGVDSNDDMKVKVYPQPDGIYNLRFDVAKTQGLLEADATKINVPHNPIVQMAFAMALRERGETGGQSAAEQFAVASTALSDAIAIDANRYPDETTFMVVQMAQQLQSITITAPGFAGINTQDAPLAQDASFSAVADNCVIDKEGRIAARKGYEILNGNDLLGSSDGVESMGEFVAADGNITFFSAGNNKIFSGTTTMVDETPAAYTITENNWKMVNFNDHMFFFQRGYEPLVYADHTGVVASMSTHTHAIGTPPEGHVAIAAFGRMWVADFVDDKSTIYWSDLLDGAAWTGGSSGSIDVTNVWPTGYDVITALAAHNGFLIIFGRNSILVYEGASSPANMTLSDTISNVGCVGRDAVVSTGKDLIFLDDSGVRSLSRTIQEKSAPIGDISKNVNNDIKSLFAAETGNISMHYSPRQAFVLLNFPELAVTYAFDTRFPLQDGSFRATTWSHMNAICFTETSTEKLYIGVQDGIAEYTGYKDNDTAYLLSYFSHPLSFGDTSNLKFLKKINLTTFDGAESIVVLNWAYDYQGNYRKQAYTLPKSNVGQYNISEFNTEAEYSSSIGLIKRKKINASGQGTVVAVGVETNVDGNSIALQEINIQALMGRIV